MSVLGVCSNILAQSPDTLWTKTYGGSGADAARSMIINSDGNIVVAGFGQNIQGNNLDIWILNIDTMGDTIWTKSYGGALADDGVDIHQTADGGYIIVGNTKSFGTGLTDIWLLRTDADGDTLWTRTFGDSSQDMANSSFLSSDGGVIISGSRIRTAGGGYNGWLIKTDTLGDTLWTESYGSPSSDNSEFGTTLTETHEGFTIWTTKSLEVETGEAFTLILKYDHQGSLIWSTGFDIPGEEQFNSLIETSDGGFILTGWKLSDINNGMDLWLVRTDSNGDTLWTKSYGGSGDDVGYDVIQTADNGFIITGYTNSYGAGGKDLWVIRTDSLGDSLWTRTYGGEKEDEGWDILQFSNNDYLIIGNTQSFGAGSYDIWLLMLSENPITVVENSINIPIRFQLNQNHPNPFNPVTTIGYALPRSGDVTLLIFNLLGEEVTRLVDGFQPTGTYQIIWDASNYSSGIYFYRLQAGDFVQTRKMVLLK
ncbi:MAG: T9SS type A sorting domain-containing protein [Candidatus Marinimicrobia bacterium]|nr:T9SS type A sorting domain-containing protein [Candidatus Neomarinimicrobiota bacterium]